MTEQKRVAVVTGASRGIGSHCVRSLTARGFRVACLSRKGAGTEDRTQDEAEAALCANFACDSADDASISAALKAAHAHFGRIDVLVNNAGMHDEGKSTEFTTEAFEALMRVNSTGVFVASREAYPYLAETQGLIINMGSYYDKLGVRFHVAYCASKAAVAAIGRCLAVEWAKAGVRLVTIAPGFIGTDLNQTHMANDRFRDFITRRIPSGQIGKPEEVGQLVAILADENLHFLNGETIYLDGGQGMNH
jgi:NAD(P)-dependent dehydrogenase (short-subunit alcohol dehydrogenase family)